MGWGRKYTPDQARRIFEKLSRDHKIFAPVNKAGQGRLSDTDLADYDEVKAFDEIDFSRKTFFSAKKLVFPLRETTFKYQGSKIEEAKFRSQPMIVFLRSCDIHGLEVIDLHFLKDSGKEDIYYRRRREKLKIFLIECPEQFENCYCVSLGTNKTDNYSVFMRPGQAGFEVKLKDEALAKYFEGGEDTVVEPKFAEKDSHPVKIPEEVPLSVFQSEMWREYSTRCIACGRCNTSCPTCTCFTARDRGGERRRIWSSCHVKGFSLLSGEHDFRKEYSDRMRYRTLHKISDFKKRAGRQMCIGCGRCDDVCPEYISLFKSLEKLNKVLEAPA